MSVQNVPILGNTDLLPLPASIFGRAPTDGASELNFNDDLPARYDPSVASVSSPLIRSDNCEALLKQSSICSGLLERSMSLAHSNK